MKLTKKDKTVELPGVKGPGVAPVTIAEIDDLAEDYVKQRDKRCQMTPKEIAAKEKLIEALHRHESKLGKNSDGMITYRYDDQVITLKPGKESLKVKSLNDEGEED